MSGGTDTNRTALLSGSQRDLISGLAQIIGQQLGINIQPRGAGLGGSGGGNTAGRGGSFINQVAGVMTPNGNVTTNPIGIGGPEFDAATGPSALQQQYFDLLGNQYAGLARGDMTAYRDVMQPSADAARRDFYGPRGSLDQIMHKYGSEGGRSGPLAQAMLDAGVDFETKLAGSQFDTLRSLMPMASSALATGGDTQRQIGTQQWMMQQPWANPWLQYLPTALSPTHTATVSGGGFLGLG